MKEDNLSILESASLVSPEFYLLSPDTLSHVKTETKVCWLGKCPQGISIIGSVLSEFPLSLSCWPCSFLSSCQLFNAFKKIFFILFSISSCFYHEG